MLATRDNQKTAQTLEHFDRLAGTLPPWDKHHWMYGLTLAGTEIVASMNKSEQFLGYCFYHVHPVHKTAHIRRMAVHPKARRQRVGSQLLAQVVEEYPQVIIRVPVDNLIMAQFLRANDVPCLCEYDEHYIFRAIRAANEHTDVD